MNKYYIGLCVILLWASHATGQNTQAMSLKECIEYGLKNDVATRRTLLDYEINKAQKREAYSNAYPQINGTGKFQYFANLPVQLLPGEIVGQPGTQIPVKFGTDFTMSGGIEASQIVYNHTVNLSVRAVKQANELTGLSLEKQKETVAYNIAQTYLQTQVIKKQKELLVVNIDKLMKLLKIVEAQYANGFAKKIDVDRLKVTETNLRTDLQNVQLTEEQLLSLLKFQMTMPLDLPILLTDTLENQSILKGAITPQEPIDIKLLAKARDLNNIQNEVVKSGYYPNVVAFGSFQTQAQRNDFDFYKSDKPWFKTTVFGLQLNVPIFDGFQKSAKMQQNTIKNMQLKLDEENVRNAVSFQQRVAQIKVQTNLNNLETQKRNVVLAEDVYRVTQEQYKAGQASLSDILNAETGMKEAQANYLRVMVELKLAELEVLKASGNIMSLVN